MGRRPSEPPPSYTLTAALHAAEQIHRLRTTAGDPDLDFFPSPVQDDTDIDHTLHYTETHRRVPASTLAAELPHRAVLATYVRQRDTAAHDRHDLAILETGETTHTPARAYGRLMGLPTRTAVSMRRRRLRDRLRAPYGPDEGHTTRDGTDQVTTWLRTRHTDLVAVAEQLVDHRATLLALLAEPQRDDLADAIDEAGKTLSSRPSRALAGAVSYAAFCLQHANPHDPVLRDLLNRAQHLRREFDAART
ncbi:hypothetical protein [Saccharopolyspora griseoalba]|uniref:Uncharacterized protein n=1 Tax=Saccharopolyspora griseoalba TaxID=1431848 RepID=A0ABW2LW62_9PSEU